MGVVNRPPESQLGALGGRSAGSLEVSTEGRTAGSWLSSPHERFGLPPCFALVTGRGGVRLDPEGFGGPIALCRYKA